MKLSLIQMDIAFGKPEENYARVKKRFEEAAREKPDVIVLPEMWTTGYDLTRLDEIADPDCREARSFLSSLTKKYGINAVGGSVARRTEAGTENTMLVYNRTGDLIKQYSKAHLFRLMNEEKYLIPGNGDGLFTLDGHPSAGVICYDIRFPDWIITHMTGKGKDTKILYVVAEWPAARTDHWRTLLITRAIENQCFVVACNRVGSDPANTFAGHSIVIGPWGEVIVEAGKEETILTAGIDLSEADHVRSKIPVFTDRRPDLYRQD